MAIDSRTKRQAITGVGRPYLRSVFPIASPTREWRSNVGQSYPVANFEAPVVGGDELISQCQTISRFVPSRIFSRVN